MIKKESRILLSYSPQGGTGKSTFAVNIGLVYASMGLKTLVLDMSVYGSVVSALKIRQKPGIGIAGIINTIDLNRNEKISVQEYVEKAAPSIVNNVSNTGLDVIISANPIKMEALNENSTNVIMKIVKNFGYDIVLVDTSPELSIKNLVLIDKANYVLVSAIQDVSCGWKMMMFKEIADRFKIDRQKFGLVINRCSKYSGFNNREFESEIGYKILYEFPEYTKDFQNYVNKGHLITSKYNTRLVRDFVSISKTLFEASG
jgi:MinD-like ATPase involved in chromosome partitioning or flagellar assembly